MKGWAIRILWLFFFVVTALFPLIAGATIFDRTPDIIVAGALAGSLMLAIYLAIFAPPVVRKRGAWILGIAAFAAFVSARVIALDVYCWQSGLTYCSALEPPVWYWPQRVLHADGHLGEDIAIFQMWLMYFLAIAIPMSAIALLLTRNRRADF